MCSRQVPQGSPGLATGPEHILVRIQAATTVEFGISQALQRGASEGRGPRETSEVVQAVIVEVGTKGKQRMPDAACSSRHSD